MKGGARAHVRPGKCFFKKVEARVCGGVDTQKLKKSGPPKRWGVGVGAKKRDRFRTVTYVALRPSRLLVVPTLLLGVGLVVRSRRVG